MEEENIISAICESATWSGLKLLIYKENDSTAMFLKQISFDQFQTGLL